MSRVSSYRMAQLLKDTICSELQIAVDVYDCQGLLISDAADSPQKQQLDMQNLSRGGSTVIPVMNGQKLCYYLDCGRLLPEDTTSAIRMFARAAMELERQEQQESDRLRRESDLANRILSADAQLYYDEIVAAATSLGYNLRHPMAILVASLEMQDILCLNMDVGFEGAGNEAKHSIVTMLKNHMYMNKHDIVAFTRNNCLVILKAVEDLEDRPALYRVLDKLSTAVSEVLTSYRIFKYYVAPGGLVRSFDEAHTVYGRAMDYISFARRMKLDHPVIDTNDILYYAIACGLPEQCAEEVIRPGAQALLDQNRESVEGLIQCFEAYIENDFNVANTADQLYLHRNTVKKRMEKLHRITGFDPMGDFRSVLMNKLILQQYELDSGEQGL